MRLGKHPQASEAVNLLSNVTLLALEQELITLLPPDTPSLFKEKGGMCFLPEKHISGFTPFWNNNI